MTRDTVSVFARGAAIVPDFVTPAEEERILLRIGAAPWLTELSRRVQHYGYRYDYRGASRPEPAAPFPRWAEVMADRLREHFAGALPVQCIVNEYRPGQGIGMHADHRDFGDVVASLSLAADWPMRFRPRSVRPYARDGLPGDEVVVLPRRSVLVLAAPRARTGCTASTAPTPPARPRRASPPPSAPSRGSARVAGVGLSSIYPPQELRHDPFRPGQPLRLRLRGSRQSRQLRRRHGQGPRPPVQASLPRQLRGLPGRLRPAHSPARSLFVFHAGAGLPRFVVNFPTKRHWRDRSRIEDIAAGLDDLAGILDRRAIRSVAVPPLGCGLGGLPWPRVRSLLLDRLAPCEAVSILVHEPARR